MDLVPEFFRVPVAADASRSTASSVSLEVWQLRHIEKMGKYQFLFLDGGKLKRKSWISDSNCAEFFVLLPSGQGRLNCINLEECV